MIQIGRKEFGISGFALRCLAIITMVLGALGFEKGAGYEGDDMAEWYKNLKF